MIGSLRGTLSDVSGGAGAAAEVLVEVGGVGYRVQVPAAAVARLGTLGGPAFVHVHTHVREDAIVLYGFPTRDERECFEALIAAHGVGPAVAIALLSVHSPAALRRAVAVDDAEALMLVPGIGKKTATRLLVELKSRLDVDGLDGDGLPPALAALAAGGARSEVRAELRAALAGLGYGLEEIRQVLALVPSDGSVEDQVRLALREMAVAR